MATPAALLAYERQARVYRRTWRGSAISTFLSPVLFLSAMGLGLGQLVDGGNGGTNLAGLDYLAFLAPGLLVATAMQTGTGDSAWPVMAGIKWVKTYQAALATPITTRDLMIGHLLWVATRLTAVSLVYVAIMAAFGALTLSAGVVAVVPAVLTGLAFAAPVAAYTSTLQSEAGLTNLFRFGIVPLFLFSGTFFPITQLPEIAQPVAYTIPTWHGVELARSITTGLPTTLSPVVHFGVLVAFVIVGTILAVWRFDIRMRT